MQQSAFYENLEPFTFLERSALVYPNKTAVIYGDQKYSYAEFMTRVNKLAGALKQSGISKGDKVAFIVPNLPPLLEGHYGPMSIGAVLVAINTRLSSREISYILNHSKAKVLVFDSEFAPVISQIRDQLPMITTYVQVVDEFPKSDEIPSYEYEEFLESAPSGLHRDPIDSELDTITINYTSGTTGMPKGVQYHARGAYLNAMGEIIETGLNWQSVYLWTLPMFHCNGWCNTWAVTAASGTHLCLRRVDPQKIYELIEEYKVTNMCGAPTVLTGMYSSPSAEGRDLTGVTIATGGAPPAPQVVRTMETMGANIIHLYGLTETYGPYTLCVPQESWKDMGPDEKAYAKSKQGIPYIHASTGVRVVDSDMNDVPRNGKSMGEVLMRSNGVMSGYFDDIDATNKAFEGGWFHSGDLAVWHADGQIELQDRAKDIIISGGENISSQEVEKVIMENPNVLEVSVIAVPDTQWGEVPKAFVSLKVGAVSTEQEIIDFCKDRIARFKAPKYVEFGDLPKTATGKIQKYVLREKEWAGQEKRIQGSQVAEPN
ncbi:MAG: long-chain-fatty-acid--CoA ligase [SAR202 cluster bacterium]|nr:long-chain-fatty-acid--CoA ligase [SAR202 cluster bacterium]|tara:strand:+ start:5895 stop:7526 length:1632 start_codon:yes stop_codon:yes gene_type:complete